MKKLYVAILIAVPAVSLAAINGPSSNSRANCYNNESITWWLGHARDWRVVSIHLHNKNNPQAGYHVIDTGFGHTWRQAAVHWNESPPGGEYRVNGYHFFKEKGREYMGAETASINCDLYDGWWNY